MNEALKKVDLKTLETVCKDYGLEFNLTALTEQDSQSALLPDDKATFLAAVALLFDRYESVSLADIERADTATCYADVAALLADINGKL